LNQSRAGRAGPRRVEDRRAGQIKAAQSSRGFNDPLMQISRRIKKGGEKTQKYFQKISKKIEANRRILLC